MAELSKKYGDRVGFIGLVVDFDSNASGAAKIVESAGVQNSFIMINANEPSVKPLRDIVQTGFVPAAAVVMKDGSHRSVSSSEYSSVLDEILK